MGNPVRRFWLFLLTGLLLTAAMPPAVASDPLADLKAQFALPDDRVNFAEAKLAVDRLIDPSTDTAALRRELDHWERAIRSNMPAGANGRQTVDALLKTMYEPGPWNDGRPFSYDLDDPLGKDLFNKRLATYLATRKGNCVSMPILVAILGQRLGLTITLSTAPHHVMAMFADDSQQAWVYIEATGGGVLCKPNDAAALADAIEELAADRAKAEALGQTGARAVTKNYSAEAMALGIEEVISKDGHKNAEICSK